MTDLAAVQARLAGYAGERDPVRDYWQVRHEGREFLLLCSPPQPKSWVLAKYPGAGVVKGEWP